MENMEKVDKVLIIPDVHGRTFWKDAVKDSEDWKIVFLGDYLDPYQYEGVTHEMALANFNEIIEFKKDHPENVTLLMGNHDCTYVYGRLVCDCRTDILHYNEIFEIFKENLNLFNFAEELEVGDKKYVFSHAPILKDWYNGFETEAEWRNKPDFFGENPVDNLNNILHSGDPRILLMLSRFDIYRGGYAKAGSVVWADVRSVTADSETLPISDYPIFGHTQLAKEPIVTKKFACLDCRRAFILDTDGKIKELDGTEVPETEL